MTEFGPSPPIESSEQEARGIALASEIASLREQASTDADYEVVMQKIKELKTLFGISDTKTELSGDIREQMEKAKEILGADFTGPEEVNAAFLGQVEITDVPAIPFSQKELERAKELGQMLILRVDKAKDGSALTMEKIHALLDGKMKDEGKVLSSVSWYKDEEFYKNETSAPSWALVSKTVIPESPDKNYFEQTKTLANYLKTEAFKDMALPAEYFEAIAEFNSFIRDNPDFAAKVESGDESEWKEAARKLEALKINRLTRQLPVEALYDLVVRYQQTGDRLLGGMYSWTSRRYSGGSLVCVGRFSPVGIRVGRSGPVASNPFFGAFFSRSQ